MVDPQDPIRSQLLVEVRAGRIAGAAWHVEDRDGVVSSGAVGSACLVPDRVPASVETPFDLASLTKPFATAVTLLRLHEEGRLDLGAPAERAIDEFRGTHFGRVSLLDLGAHRSGLPAWAPLYLSCRDLESCLAEIARSEPAVPAGRTLYSDLGYIALGAAAERAAGRGLDHLFDAAIAVPLALRRTGFALPRGRFSSAAATEVGNRYERRLAGDAGVRFPWRETIPRGEVHDGNAHLLGGVAGHAGLFGSAAEVATIGLALLPTGRLALSSESRALLLRPVAGDGSRTFGFTLAGLSGAARDVLPASAPGHTGFTGTSIWLEPERGRVHVLLTNRVHPDVPAVDFQSVRREFHRRARDLGRGR